MSFRDGEDFTKTTRHIEFEEMDDVRMFLLQMVDCGMFNEHDRITVTGQLKYQTINGSVDYDSAIEIIDCRSKFLAECLKPY